MNTKSKKIKEIKERARDGGISEREIANSEKVALRLKELVKIHQREKGCKNVGLSNSGRVELICADCGGWLRFINTNEYVHNKSWKK